MHRVLLQLVAAALCVVLSFISSPCNGLQQCPALSRHPSNVLSNRRRVVLDGGVHVHPQKQSSSASSRTFLWSSNSDDEEDENDGDEDDDMASNPAASTGAPATMIATLNERKAKIVEAAEKKNDCSVQEMRALVKDLEDEAELAGVGQASSLSGLLSGEWELLYSPDDVTRSSPFFWAFERAFPDNSDQIFSITDSIPAPIKEVGPAFQEISYDASTQNGKFVSRVKVATLMGKATSIMTTRATIVGADGIDGIRLKIETTKPEQSTVVETLFGPVLGGVINESAPAFPSGQALESVRPGSSEVVMRTTYCDEGLRISRNDDKPDDVYVFRRKSFASFDYL